MMKLTIHPAIDESRLEKVRRAAGDMAEHIQRLSDTIQRKAGPR